jgi:hypothetical protein
MTKNLKHSKQTDEKKCTVLLCIEKNLLPWLALFVSCGDLTAVSKNWPIHFYKILGCDFGIKAVKRML